MMNSFNCCMHMPPVEGQRSWLWSNLQISAEIESWFGSIVWCRLSFRPSRVFISIDSRVGSKPSIDAGEDISSVGSKSKREILRRPTKDILRSKSKLKLANMKLLSSFEELFWSESNSYWLDMEANVYVSTSRAASGLY